MQHCQIEQDLERSQTQSQLYTLSVADQVIPENLLRLNVCIQPAASNQLQVRLGSTNAASGGFISLLPGDFPLLLPLALYGDLIRKEFVISGTVGDSFIFTETVRDARK